MLSDPLIYLAEENINRYCIPAKVTRSSTASEVSGASSAWCWRFYGEARLREENAVMMGLVLASRGECWHQGGVSAS